MKTYYIWLLCAYCAVTLAYSQNNVAIGDTYQLPHPSASLELQSTNKGFLLNRLTTSQRDSIQNPALSLMIFNTTNDRYEYFDGITWIAFGPNSEPNSIPWSPVLIGKYPVQNITTDKNLLIGIEIGQRFFVIIPRYPMQVRALADDWVGSVDISSAVIIDSSLYVLFRTGGSNFSYKLFMYDLYDIQSGGVEVTFSNGPLPSTQSSIKVVMTSDGEYMYFNYDAGNSIYDYVVARYLIVNQTTLQYQNSVSYGSTVNTFRKIFADKNSRLIGFGESSNAFASMYHVNGVFIKTSGSFQMIPSDHVMLLKDAYYYSRNASGFYMRIWLE